MRLAYRFSFLWTAAHFLALATSLFAQASPEPSIEVGEPVHVSAVRPEVPYVEPYVTAHPQDPEVLVGAAVALPDGSTATTRVDVFRSGDHGLTWEPVAASGCHIDPWLDFDAAGNVYLVCLGEGRGEVLLLRSFFDYPQHWVASPSPACGGLVRGDTRQDMPPDQLSPIHNFWLYLFHRRRKSCPERTPLCL